MLENKQRISEITIKTKTTNICSIGGERYTNNFRIQMIPSSHLPDYCTVDKYVSEQIEGRQMIIEEAVDTLFLYIINTYRPTCLEVSSHVTDAAHSEVTVVKRYGSPNWR